MRTIKFKSLSSGSCGNCYYLGIEEYGLRHGILIDAGVSPRRLKKELSAEGMGMDDFEAILITHDHLDHIRSLGSYCKHVQKPVFTTPVLGKVLARHFITGPYMNGLRHEMAEGWNDIVPGYIRARWFIVPHDASETVGYAISVAEHLYVHITDCGKMTEETLYWCRRANTVVLESNYDPDMLANGPYPIDLQQRICSGHGHLSNGDCAQAITKFVHKGLGRIFLCHLSEHNNTPGLALESALSALPEDSDTRIIPLPRQTPSPLYYL